MRSNHLFDKIPKGIDAIIFCEFDVHLGPVLKHQYPENYVTKETFESLSVYLIPKPELYGKLITITAYGMKILGYPVSITDAKYQRNQLIFNLCFVFSHFTSTTQYEPIIHKLAHYLIDLEAEMGFISKKDIGPKLSNYLVTIRDDLNASGICTIKISLSTTIHLKLTKVQTNPRQVEDYHVPILNSNHFNTKNICQWDLTTQQIYYYIDGVNHVSKIAFMADVDINLVKACIQNLIYYGLVSLVPIFLYSNVYVTTPKIRLLLENPMLRDECLREIRKDGSIVEPSLKKILQLYSNMCPGMTVKDLCQRFVPHSNGIDEQKLVKFGIMKGIIRRIQKYPIQLNEPIEEESDPYARVNSPTLTQSLMMNRSTSSPQSNTSTVHYSKDIYTYFDGKHSYDQLCCEFNRTYQEIENKVEKNPAVVVCWK
ncbi:nitrogen permease regulator-like 2 [Dermatophagoides farinae]|uniref:Nitrogen permease regulator 2-like protein n=1 Tax=Dermatophagoides farinae TaxID=6954 RepID=A0A9D4NXV7_DERFA|nr:GATOR complex protein NPRL2-like [Dermatophagoides farinae]KAH7640423.1 nitrogen permease regulator 2-like protein [Dermatophagoides farinae]